MMSNYILIAIYAISLLSFGGFTVKAKLDERQAKKVTSTLNKQLMEANLEIGRAKTKFGNASKQIENLEEELKEEIRDRNSVITRFGQLKARYNVLASHKTEASIEIKDSVFINECPELDLEEGRLYVAKDKELGLLDAFTAEHQDHRILIGCTVEPRVTPGGSIPVGIAYDLNLKLKAELLETITPTGAINNYIRLYEINDDDAIVGTFDIQAFDMIVDDQRDPRFLWWDPHMDMSIGLGLRNDSSIENLHWEGASSVGLTVVSYGLSSKDLAWRFARLSFGIGQEVSIGFTPVLYNVGNDLPVLTNLWVGLSTHYGLTNKKWGTGVTIGANL